MTITEIIIVASCIITFYTATHAICLLENRDAKFYYLKREPENPHKVANYFIPGLLRAPMKAFEQLADETVGDAIFIDLNGLAWNSTRFAQQIADHAAKNGYEDVRIFAISVGDKIARKIKSVSGANLRQQARRVASFDINPCANPCEVKARLRVALRFGAPLFWLVTFLLGPLGYLSLIPGDQPSKRDKNRHSLVELSTQLLAIGYEKTGKFRWGSYIILSKEDTLLDNAAISADAGCKLDNLESFIQIIHSGHADIIGYRDNYLDALNDLGAFDDDY